MLMLRLKKKEKLTGICPTPLGSLVAISVIVPPALDPVPSEMNVIMPITSTELDTSFLLQN